jgi:hypothetical protein
MPTNDRWAVVGRDLARRNAYRLHTVFAIFGRFHHCSATQVGVDARGVNERLMGGGMKQGDADTLVKGVPIDTWQVKKDGSLVKTQCGSLFLEGLCDGPAAFDDHHDLWHERGALHYSGKDLAHF